METLKKELGAFILLVIAIALSWTLVVGFIYNIAKAIYHSKGYKLGTALIHIAKYWGNVLYQVWVVVKKVFYYTAFILDLLGNALLGELIEDLVTHEENTYYGKGDRTISVATGDIELRNKTKPGTMNSIGLWFVGVLNKFESNHCSKAIRRWHFNQKLNQEK